MKKCPKCGSTCSDKARFCGKCGADLSVIHAVKRKKRIWTVFLMIALIGSMVVGGKIFMQNRANEDTIVMLSGETLKVLTNQKANRTIDIPADSTTGIRPSELKFSLDGKYICYLTNYDEIAETGDLYICEYRKLKQKSSANEKYCKKIAADVMLDFAFAEKNRVIYRDKNKNLYLYDGIESRLIDESVSQIFYTDDLSKLVYQKGVLSKGHQVYGLSDGYQLYGVELKDIDNKIRIAGNYSWIHSIKNYNEIFCAVNEEEDKTTLYLTGFDKTSEKLGYMIENSYLWDNEIMFYSAERERTVGEVFEALLTDSRGDTDELEEMRCSFSEAYKNEKSVTLNMIQDEKDQMISDAVFSSYTYGDAIVFWDLGNAKPIDVAQYQENTDGIRSVVEDLFYNNCYVVSGITGKVIQIDDRDALDELQGINHYSKLCVTDTDIVFDGVDGIMAGAIKDGKAVDFQVVDSGLIQRADAFSVYYEVNKYKKDEKQYMDIYEYKNGTSNCLMQNVLLSRIIMYEDGSILAYADGEDGSGNEFVLLDAEGKINKIAESELRPFIQRNDFSVLYLKNSDLWIYEAGENTELAENVSQIWSLNQMKVAGELGYKFLE